MPLLPFKALPGNTHEPGVIGDARELFPLHLSGLTSITALPHLEVTP